jgi:hypothetical protein
MPQVVPTPEPTFQFFNLPTPYPLNPIDVPQVTQNLDNAIGGGFYQGVTVTYRLFANRPLLWEYWLFVIPFFFMLLLIYFIRYFMRIRGFLRSGQANAPDVGGAGGGVVNNNTTQITLFSNNDVRQSNALTVERPPLPQLTSTTRRRQAALPAGDALPALPSSTPPSVIEGRFRE